MDFSNDDFLNWVLQQTEIELPQQPLLNPQETQKQQPAGSNNETMAATTAPYTLTFDNAQPTPDLDMLFTPQQWDQGIPLINSNDHSPLMQSYHSGSSTSGSSSDSSDKESSPLPRSPSPPATKGRFTSKAALKPFIPEDIEPPTNADHRTMPTTGRLDFRVTATPDYNVSASDLKKMTSKERRQLRNKISARNFRQRRKDYITSLEEEIEELKSDKAQMRNEINKVYDLVSKLRKENEKLRTDMMMVRQQQQQQPQQPSPDIPTMSVLNNTDENALTTWDALLRDSTWLSHASMPQWDFSHVLSKDQEKSSLSLRLNAREMIQRYPLLAPALMSIVLDHTMGMSSEQLLAASTSTSSSIPLYNNRDGKALMPLLYEALQERRASISEITDDEDMATASEQDDDDSSDSDVDEEDDEDMQLVKRLQQQQYEEAASGDSMSCREWVKNKLCCLNGRCEQQCCVRRLACYAITAAYQACVQQLCDIKQKDIEGCCSKNLPETPTAHQVSATCAVQCGC
ncbi:hypothetical protein O0I10_000593 [Lichtheimia ornata]|uniref:BZIP domain-containing protein n=1 Tax=Lichtheimia ornata TaxID=688661 RepID=A0AAD7Y3Y1_9FUNG|nr:uncharacterized protein O0I10_000593 [Lichtheimia ornata]KAJ8663354.1 hypothetical protein O0I10_000593 [Lichtheimia ornata]